MSRQTFSHVSRAWSCQVRLVVADERALGPAADDLGVLLDRVDAAASRFRPDSALSIANTRAGRPTPIPRLLVDLLGAALGAAAWTAGAVDPTLGLAMHRLGYDRDFGALVTADDHGPAGRVRPPRTNGWRAVKLQREAGLVTVPLGTALDLGATAKAWTADTAARVLAARYDTAVLVELGGDLAVRGRLSGGWGVRVAERQGGPGQVVTVEHGGVATSTTTVRHWRRGGRRRHHILDPATGLPAAGPWRTATVAAASALEANAASTAAIVLGERALGWLTGQRLPARLVAQDGSVAAVGSWPAAEVVAA